MEWIKFSDRRPTNEECERNCGYIFVLEKEYPYCARMAGWYKGIYDWSTEYTFGLREIIEKDHDYWCPTPELPDELRSIDGH